MVCPHNAMGAGPASRRTLHVCIPHVLTRVGTLGVSWRRDMVALTFPDGARREYPQDITGLDIAKGISPSLAKRTVAMALDGAVADLSDKIERDAKIEFLT